MRPRWSFGWVVVALLWLAAPVPAWAQWYDLNFIVYDGTTGARLGNARVTIDADFGNGWERWTDGGGYANFGVYSDQFSAPIGWRVERAGYHAVTGSVHVSNHQTVWVGMTTSSPPPGQNGVGEPIHHQTGQGLLSIIPFESNWDASSIEMYMSYTAPTGRFEKTECLRFWPEHPEWGPEELNCQFEAQTLGVSMPGVGRFWEDDYAWWWPPFTGTVYSAYLDYLHGQQVRYPESGETNPLQRTWRGYFCHDEQAIDRLFAASATQAIREAWLAGGIASRLCIGATIGYVQCVGISFYGTMLSRIALDYFEYKDACAY